MGRRLGPPLCLSRQLQRQPLLSLSLTWQARQLNLSRGEGLERKHGSAYESALPGKSRPRVGIRRTAFFVFKPCPLRCPMHYSPTHTAHVFRGRRLISISSAYFSDPDGSWPPGLRSASPPKTVQCFARNALSTKLPCRPERVGK